jgi:hypothetical protein
MATETTTKHHPFQKAFKPNVTRYMQWKPEMSAGGDEEMISPMQNSAKIAIKQSLSAYR